MQFHISSKSLTNVVENFLWIEENIYNKILGDICFGPFKHCFKIYFWSIEHAFNILCCLNILFYFKCICNEFQCVLWNRIELNSTTTTTTNNIMITKYYFRRQHKFTTTISTTRTFFSEWYRHTHTMLTHTHTACPRKKSTQMWRLIS